MKYCLNISNTLDSDFRLQKNGDWKKCVNSTKISEGDFFYLDSYNDLQTILDIKPSGEIDERTGLPLIDDDTLPDWMLVKDKRNPDKILYSPDNKPWISNRVMFSVLMGAIKELNQKMEELRF